jgi:hypothetical protein
MDSAGVAVNDCVLLAQDLDGAKIMEWVGRIKEVPDYVFHDICREVASVPNMNFWNSSADLVVSWLLERRDKLDQLIWDNQAAFPKVQWPFWELGEPIS